MVNDKCTAGTSPIDSSSIEKWNRTADTKGDEASQFASGQAIEIDAETNSRILRKIDLHILSWIFGLYAPQYLDKTALGYAAIMGIKDDTNINNSQYSWSVYNRFYTPGCYT